MEKISEMVAAKGLEVSSFEKFIGSRKDQITTRWGCFDTYGRNSLHCIGLFDDIIVVIAEDSQYEQGYKVSSGIGHEVYMYACSTDMARHWECSECISYRDQYDQYKDRMGPIPKEFVSISPSADAQTLKVTTLMPNGSSRIFFLEEKVKG